jgi:hypothetical protein
MKDPWARHDQLAPESNCVCAAADCLDGSPVDVMRSQIDHAYAFLTRRFLPNARGEQRLRHRLADRDHRCVAGDVEVDRIEALTVRLGVLKANIARRGTEEAIREIRRVLYEIAALLRLHYGGATA